jgi:hypothetical protein
MTPAKYDREKNARIAANKIRRMVADITKKGLKQFADGLDSETPFAERTVGTAFSEQVYKQVMANNREATRAVASLGVVMTQARMKDLEWERRCVEAELEREGAIDVKVEP